MIKVNKLLSKKGFTLIELLVVIAIIGILATIIVASFTSAQARGRDARRKADLDAVKKALELRKADSLGGAWYPNCNGGSGNCVLNLDGTSLDADLTTPTYIRTVPQDPAPVTGSYEYRYYPTGCTGPSSPAQCSLYTLVGCLENASDQSGITPPGSGPGSQCPASSRAYLVTSP